MADRKIVRKRRRLYDPLTTEERDHAYSGSLQSPAGEIDSKEKSAILIIKRYAKWSAGSSLIPIPILDMAAVTAIQLRMLQKLCSLYEMEFSDQKGKSLIASLIGGFHAGVLSGSLLKMVPLLGATVTVSAMALVAGALTYAVGKVFVQHFETGGTLLNFAPHKFKETFLSQYNKARNVSHD